MLPGYAASRAFSMAAIGLLLSANRLVRLLSNPLVGLLLIPFFAAQSAKPWMLLAGVVISATGQAMVLTVTPPLAREMNPGQASGVIVGLLANAADFGMAFAPLAAYSLLGLVSLEEIYLIAGAGLAAGLILTWFVPKSTRSTPSRRAIIIDNQSASKD